MLVLSRRRDEIIVIGDTILVTVVDIRGDKVRLGVHAPGLAVHRKEVYDLVRRELAAGLPIHPTQRQRQSAQHGHLVLSRQRDESLMIGDDILVTIVDVRGDKVRVGVAAPKDLSVHRKEVWDIIRKLGGDGVLGRGPAAQHAAAPDGTGQREVELPLARQGGQPVAAT